jgi:hypothetical protein
MYHSPATKEDGIRLESTGVDTFDNVRIKANRECSVYMDRDDAVGASPLSVEFVGRVDFKRALVHLNGSRERAGTGCLNRRLSSTNTM